MGNNSKRGIHPLVQVDECDDRGCHVDLGLILIVAQQVPQQALQKAGQSPSRQGGDGINENAWSQQHQQKVHRAFDFFFPPPQHHGHNSMTTNQGPWAYLEANDCCLLKGQLVNVCHHKSRGCIPAAMHQDGVLAFSPGGEPPAEVSGLPAQLNSTAQCLHHVVVRAVKPMAEAGVCVLWLLLCKGRLQQVHDSS
jgi:hypothetical protein